MQKYIIYTLLLFAVCSCKARFLGVRKKSLISIDKQFKAGINNNSHLDFGLDKASSALAYFNFRDIKADSIYINFDEKERLGIRFRDSIGLKTYVYEGRFTKQGYYEVYLKRYQKAIPPVIPFLFCFFDIDKLTITMTKNQQLVMNRKWSRGWRVLIIGDDQGGECSSFYTYK